jgi:hypothetical protein
MVHPKHVTAKLGAQPPSAMTSITQRTLDLAKRKIPS